MTNYYLSHNFREEGPYSLPRILAMHGAGRLEGEYYVRAEESDTWVPLADMLAEHVPAATAPDAPPPPSVPANWRRVGRLAVAVQIFLWLEILFNLVSTAFLWRILGVLSAWLQELEYESPLLDSFDDLETSYLSLAFPQLGVSLFTVLFFCLWLYAAAKQARHFSGKSLGMSPGFIAASFFIPILNFWKPYMGVKRVYNASLGGKAPFTKRSGLVLAWWLCFLLMNYANNIGSHFVMKTIRDYEHAEESREQFLIYMRSEMTSHQFDLAASLLTVPAALITIVLIRRLTRAQNRLVENARHG